MKQNFGFINQVDKVNCLPLREWKLTFLALALRQSESLKLWVAISLYREWWSYALGRNMSSYRVGGSRSLSSKVILNNANSITTIHQMDIILSRSFYRDHFMEIIL